MRIEHQGQSRAVKSVETWVAQRLGMVPGERDLFDAQARDGILTDNEGHPLPESLQKRVKARLLGTYADTPEPLTFGEQLREHDARGGTRYLIPDLWPWGTYPALGGPPGVGKTVLVADLVASLLVPGRRFLNYFKPVTLTEDERDRTLWLVNTEMARGPMLDALAEAGVLEHSRLVVDHLDDLGGPGMFDLTNPDIFDMWEQRLPWCEGCVGADEVPPVVVIVDNLTAVLQEVGKPLEHYGELHGAFVRLMAAIDCPNGLTVMHNTLEGGHGMGGVTGQNRQAGRWSYWSANGDDPHSPRYFKVAPRYPAVAVPKTRVLLGDDGRLRLDGSPARQKPTTAAAPNACEDEVLVGAQRTAAYVREHPGADGQELSDHVESFSKGQNLEGRSRAVDLGLIREEPCGSGCGVCDSPHHRRRHYWPPPE